MRLILDGTVARVPARPEGRPRSRCSWRSACAPTKPEDAARDQEHGRGRRRRPGVRCSTISSGADCERRSWSSSTARRASSAVAALWPDMAVQRCTVHKHRNLLAHAPERLHEEISNDYRDMIYAATRGEVENPAQGVHPQISLPNAVRRRRQPGGSRRQAVHIHAVPAEPMEIDPNLERDRAIAPRSSSAGSRLRPCCPAPKPPPCCSGRCSPQGRSPCARSTGWQTLAEGTRRSDH